MPTSQQGEGASATVDRRPIIVSSASLAPIREDAGEGLGETGGTGTGAGPPLPCHSPGVTAEVAPQEGEEPLGPLHMWKRFILTKFSGGKKSDQAPGRRSSSLTSLSVPSGQLTSGISSSSAGLKSVWAPQSRMSSVSRTDSGSSGTGRSPEISTPTLYNRRKAEADEKSRFTLKGIVTTKWRHGEALSFIHPFWLTFENKDLEHQWKMQDLHYFAALVVRILACLALALPLFLLYCNFICRNCESTFLLPLIAISPSSIIAAAAYCCPVLQIRFRGVFTLWCCWIAVATVFFCEPSRLIKLLGLSEDTSFALGETGWMTTMPLILFSAILGGVEWPKFALITLVETTSVIVAISFLSTPLKACSRIPLQVFNAVTMIIANFTVRRLEIYRRLRYLEYRFAAGQLRCFEDEAARFIKASPVEDAFYCIKESERLLSEQLYAPEKGKTTTQTLYRCILYLTRAQIKLSLFDEKPATDPFFFYRADYPFSSPDGHHANDGAVGERPTSGAERFAAPREYHVAISESGGEDVDNTATKTRQIDIGTSNRTPEAAGDISPTAEPDVIERETSPVRVPTYKRKHHITSGRRMLDQRRNEAFDKFGDALACAFGIPSPQPPPPLRAKPVLRGLKQAARSKDISVSRTWAKDPPSEAKPLARRHSFVTLGAIDDNLFGLVERVGEDWDLDMFELCKQTNRMTLMATGFRLQHRFLAEYEPAFHLCTSTWRNFLREVSQRYRHNPYHNEQHGAAVAHMMVFLLRACQAWHMFKPLYQTAIIVAALVHDVGHFAMNNHYVVNSGHPLAITYNDRSVLENFHSALAFRIMGTNGNENFNITETFSAEDKRDFRKLIIELVLETDILFHFDFIGRFRLRRPMSPFFKLLGERGANPSFGQNPVSLLSSPSRTATDVEATSKEEAQDLTLLAKACIRSADVGHAAVEWRQHYFYSKAVQTEFFNQGKAEKRLRLRISPCCDPVSTDVPKCQDGFISYISRPLFEELALINTNGAIMQKCVPLLKANQATWNRIKTKGIEWNSAEALQEGFKTV
ncbi:3'5'-cyclic nucleotide phosphodiesterase domain-containing protein [Toxoplasma gondii TgCatPRC2]|uniref:Phosphodiesterase n=1 Tax=Toxoplasma gondii TgCatPRC2 TaxID=1130821 RepID=A0A151H1Y9_TOXGO|nr:3'5'-cyclic nucleotide phosphodiesterase domain-containing protein [Toxoplasma gondii TgCatPRC2]